MQIPLSALLGLVYGASEVGIAALKRARDDSVDADRRSLGVLWIVILLAVAAGVVAAARLPQLAIGGGRIDLAAGVILFALGLALRWYAIVHLGRFFTVNVAIHSGHEVIDTGPFRHIRHPSYTGAIVAFAGLGLSMENWASVAVIVVPVIAAFAHRMSIEELALASALGAPYTSYMQRTKRLIPFVY